MTDASLPHRSLEEQEQLKRLFRLEAVQNGEVTTEKIRQWENLTKPAESNDNQTDIPNSN